MVKSMGKRRHNRLRQEIQRQTSPHFTMRDVQGKKQVEIFDRRLHHQQQSNRERS